MDNKFYTKKENIACDKKKHQRLSGQESLYLTVSETKKTF
jgi:hypothetical protein